MDKFKGTRGPWFVSNEGVLLVRDESGLSIVAKYIGYPNDDEEVANANLIASAPELLESLQLIIAEQTGTDKSCGHNGFTCLCAYNKSRAAISKALGK